MAQVKKYKEGNTVMKPKFGTVTTASGDITVDDIFVQQAMDYAKDKLDDRGLQQYSNIIKSLMSGQNINVDTLGVGEVSGDINFNVSNKQKHRLYKSRSSLGSMFGAIWGGKEQKAREAVSTFAQFISEYSPQRKVNTYDWSSEKNLEYKTNEDGTLKEYKDDAGNVSYKLLNTPESLSAINRVKSLMEIPTYSDEDEFKGYGGLDKNTYLNFVNAQGQNGIDALTLRIETGMITPEDIEILKDFGIITAKNKSSENKSNSKDAFKVEHNGVVDLNQPKFIIVDSTFIKNDDGTYSLSKGSTNPFGNNKRLKINDYFLRKRNEYRPLEGGFWFDNKFIPKHIAEDKNGIFYQNLVDWIENNRKNNFDSNNITVFGDYADPYITYEDSFFVPGLKRTNGMRFRTVLDDDNQTVYAYYDDESPRNIYGQPTQEGIRYMIYDKKTGKTMSVDPKDEWKHSYMDSDAVKSNNRWINYHDQADGYYEIPFTDGEMKFSFFRNPYDKYDMWYYKDDMEQPFKLTPEEIDSLVARGIIMDNPQNWNGHESPSRKDLENFGDDGSRNSWGIPLLKLINPIRGSKYNRTPINIFASKMKEGGAIDTTRNVKQLSNPEKSATGKDIKSLDLTKADKMQLGAIAADVAALVAAIPTGGNPVSAGLGAAGTLAQFGADVKRDGFDLSDLGYAVMGLGIDAASLLPGVGVAARIPKTAKALKNGYRLLQGVLIAGGSVAGATALTKIVSDPSNATLDDWRNLSLGLIATKGIYDTAKNAKFIKAHSEPKTANNKPSPVKHDEALTKAKNADQIKKELVDQAIKNNPELVKHEGNVLGWYDEATQTVKNYDEAWKGLRTNDHISNTDIESKLSFADRSILRARNTPEKIEKSASNFLDKVMFLVDPTFKNRQLKPEFNRNELSPLDKYRYQVLQARTYFNRPKPKKHENGGVIKAFSGTKLFSGDFWKNIGKNINTDMIYGLTDYFVSDYANKEAARKEKAAIDKMIAGSQKQMPTEIYPVFTDNGLHRTYDDRIKTMRSQKVKTSDATLAMAENLARDQYIDQLKSERDSKFSSLIDQHKQNVLQTKQAYADQRRTISDANRLSFAQGEASKLQVDSMLAQKKAQNLKNLIYQFRQDNARDNSERLAAEQKLGEMNANTAFNNELMNFYNKLPDNKKMSAEDQKEWGNNIVGFLMSKPEFQTYILDLRNKHYFNTIRDLYNFGDAHSWFGRRQITMEPYSLIRSNDSTGDYFSRKKGGKLRKLHEQHFLDQNKATHKALSKLDDNIFKLLMKMMS